MASRTHLKFLDASGVSKFQNMGSRGHFPLSLVTWGKQVIHSLNSLSHTQKGKMNWTIVLCSYYFTFRLWENWYELWVENFLRFTRGTKIGFEKPILKFRVPAGHEKFQRLREANFCLPREPEKTFHEQFISVWAQPKGKIIRTDCFFSFLRVFACIWSIKLMLLDNSYYGCP